jgi:pSer/pThr/pTyr-binding forkhead associated (FHA) protein
VAKLTLSFKDRKLKIFTLKPGDCVVGRDPGCDIVIDSLAVEPQHARIRFADNQYTIEPVNAGCRLSVDDQPVVEARELGDGDSIQIGKHSLGFSAGSEQPVAVATVTLLPSAAWLQIQSGVHMGRTIRLNKAFTRVGKPQGELAVIAHRDDGYYLSTLQGEQGPQLNEQEIGQQTRKLQNADRIVIDELHLQFFADGVAAQSSAVPPDGRSQAQQRQFSRIPFEVGATLQHEQQQWETALLDISLHGALIQSPGSFEPLEEKQYRLAVHLEGGPDINMDVEIAHHQDDKLGLRCVHIDVDSITHLRRLVELNLGDPELLERELSSLG